MSAGRRPAARHVVAILLLLAAAGFVTAATSSDASGQAEGRDDAASEHVHTVSPNPNSTREIWPYTSRDRSFESATLPINMVVLEDATMVRNVLMLRPEANWVNQSRGLNGSGTAETGDEGEVVSVQVNPTGRYWSDARGAGRYTYVRDPSPGSGQWLKETYQLHDGDYFGTRYHIRFYEVPDGENTWTALQAHREHFDWFRLRHTVGSLPRAQHYVESQFYDQWYVAEVSRLRFTNGGILHSDGWATVVDLQLPSDVQQSMAAMMLGSVIGLAGGWASRVDRRDVRELLSTAPVDVQFMLVVGSIAAIPLFVRVGALAVERAELVNSPKVVAGAFYPFLALGLPICAYVLARGLDREEAFVAGLTGLGVGVLADYAYLGIETLPLEVVAHRAFLLVALGLVAAAGATQKSDGKPVNRTLLVGGLLWIAGLLWPLFMA